MSEPNNYQQLASVLAQQLVRYGQHEPDCKSWLDEHVHIGFDVRIVCDDFPCTCGLIEVLQPLMPSIKLHQASPVAFKPVFTLVRSTQNRE